MKVMFILLCFLIAGLLLQEWSLAQTCTCPTGWYVCNKGKKCCTGSGCASYVCGPCPGGWYWQPGGPGGAGSYCPADGSYCGPNACIGCGSHIKQPLQRNVPGYVWVDQDNNNWLSTADKLLYPPGWNYTYSLGKTAWSCIGPTGFGNLPNPATQTIPGLGVARAGSWGCLFEHGEDPIYRIGRGPLYQISGLWTNQTYFIYITLPTGYSCSDVQWRQTYCCNRFCDNKCPPTNKYGTGCSIMFDPTRYRNELDWKIKVPTVKTTAITGKIYETNNPGACSNNGTIALPGLNATIYNGVTTGKTGAVDQNTGNFTITTWSNDRFDSLCINGNISNAESAYDLACVQATASLGAYSCSKGSGACAITCTPNNILTTNNSVIINLGFNKLTNKKWIATLDGDVYASSIVTYVATAPLGGFSSNLVNTFDSNSVGGFGFVGGVINTQTAGSKVSEQGGAGEDLNNGKINFEDNWFNKFTFIPPFNVSTTPPSDNNFEAGKIYSLTSEQFNNLLKSKKYSINASDESRAETAIVYITDREVISINDTFTTDKPDTQNLLVITKGSVNIASTVTTPIETFLINSPAQIDLNIVSLGNITIDSQYDNNKQDSPIMLNGTLISRNKINLQRDLGPLNNSKYPAEVIKFYSQLSNLIRKYELKNTSVFNYTGLSVFDVQFNYTN